MRSNKTPKIQKRKRAQEPKTSKRKTKVAEPIIDESLAGLNMDADYHNALLELKAIDELRSSAACGRLSLDPFDAPFESRARSTTFENAAA